MFSEKATKIDEIFTDNLMLCSNCQIVGEDFVDFCGLLRKHELYLFQVLPSQVSHGWHSMVRSFDHGFATGIQ